MVSKVWKACFQQEAAAQQVHRRSFYLCQWQRSENVKIIYLLYRWLAAILFLAVQSCSMLDIGRSEPQFEHHYAKWWIYLTDWSLLACTLQAWLAAFIVTRGLMVDRDDFGIEVQRQSKTGQIHKLYWLLYTIGTVFSFIVTIIYWTLVHDPDIHKTDAVNMMVHVMNSIMMLIDLAIVGQPIRMSHIYFTTGMAVVYASFTAIYWLAGGTDRKLQRTIYPILDWSQPGKAIVVSAFGVVFTFIMHVLVFLLYRIRLCIYTKLCIRYRNKKSSIARTLSTHLDEGAKENFLNPTAIIDVRI